MTEIEELLDKLRHQKGAIASSRDDEWKRMRAEWIEDVQRLMDRIVVWLRKAEEDDLVTLDRITVAISERDGDLYRPAALRVIAPNGRFVEIVPKARTVLGALGRVDLVSRRGRAILARFNPGEWSFVWDSAETGAWRSEPLTEESLARTLKEMLA